MPKKVYMTYKPNNNIFQAYLRGLRDPNEIAKLSVTKNKTFYKETTELHNVDLAKLAKIEQFLSELPALIWDNKKDYYYTFNIPKKTGGYRKIEAPMGALKEAQTELKNIMEKHQLFHDNAFAYIKERNCIDALQKHVNNESVWYMKLDLKDFFGSCNSKFIIEGLAQVYPYDHLAATTKVKIATIACLDDKLPQGTPLSPLLTNILFTPYDQMINSSVPLKDLIYTRYADDLIFSSKEPFNPKHVQNVIKSILTNTPFRINDKKTRYGSNRGSNWNLGVIINRENKMSLGHENKQKFRATINNYLYNLTQNNKCSILEAQALLGNINYYRTIEATYIDFCIKRLSDKYNINVRESLIEIIKGH